jgi:transcriptional regulator with GAF, ATPase, and Fis domain
MTEDREAAVTRSFVALATSLALGADIVELLTRLTTDCARLLDVKSAGLLLGDARGVLHVMAASSERTHEVELFQTQRAEGPCLDCYRTGSPVSVVDLSADHRWPRFAAAATDHGFSSVHAVPMRLREHTLGALGLFGEAPGSLNAEDLTLAQALADVASVALVQHEFPVTPESVTVRLQAALNARVQVEQAKGVLAYTGGTSTHAAFDVLRAYADERGQPLSTVAAWVVHGDLPARSVLEHASRGRTEH